MTRRAASVARPTALGADDPSETAARLSPELTARARRHDTSTLLALRAFESRLGTIARSVRLLPAVTARNAAAERARLQMQLERGEMPLPNFVYAAPRPCRASLRWLDVLRLEAAHLPGGKLYAAKLDELELDVALLASLGDARLVRPLAARRFGTGDELVALEHSTLSLIDYSKQLLQGRAARSERKSVPADAPDGSPSLRALIEWVGHQAGLPVSVRVEPNLTAGAASGDQTVFIADRHFSRREAWRLALHEVLGHVTSATNGRAQPLRLLEWGTAFSFADQEGVALCVEAEFGLLDRARLCCLAGRVLATRSMHAGASFGETAKLLYKDYGFSAADSIAISERAHRGGGVARDAGYLLGYARVREALRRGDTTLDELRMGRLDLAALPEARSLLNAGLLRPPRHRPNLARSFFSTSSGTMPRRSPPRDAASLMSVELT